MTDPNSALPTEEQDDTTQTADDTAYDQAWAEGQPDDAPTVDETTGDEGETQSGAGKNADDPDQTGDETPAGGATGESDSLDATDGKAAGGKPAESELTKAEKEELKRWQGRTKKAREEAEAEEARLTKLREEAAAAAAAKAEEETDEDRAELESVRADYPQIDKLIDSKLKKTLKTEVPKVVDERVGPVSERVDASVAKAHVDAIAAKHSDFVEVANSEEFSEWLSKVTYEEGRRYRKVIKSGSAEEVVGMFDAFKQSRPKPKQDAENPDSKRRQQLDAAGAAVRHRSGGAPQGRANKNDYDAGWEEGRKRSA